MTIKSWAEEDRPREKLLLKGKRALSEAELIAIIIASGNDKQTAVELSQHILHECQYDLNKLAKLSVKDLQQFKGIGEAKAIGIVAALELGRRRKDAEPIKDHKINSSKSAFDLLIGDFQDLPNEEFWVVFLRRNHTMIKKEMISKGGVSGLMVDPKIVYKRALEESASALIVAHNHPSGSLKPSDADIDLTEKLKAAGEVLQISVLDHLIITDSNFFSFADQEML
ncbi:MAG: DNA repair protein RadC [Bacteroidota bacterium]